jgi:hypothetical protein
VARPLLWTLSVSEFDSKKPATPEAPAPSLVGLLPSFLTGLSSDERGVTMGGSIAASGADDGESTERSTSWAAGWVDDLFSLDRTSTATSKDATTGVDVATAAKTQLRGGKGESIIAHDASESTTFGKEQHANSWGVKLSEKDKSIAGTRARSRTGVRDDGQALSEATASAASIGKKGASAQKSWAEDNVDAGWKTSAALGADVDWSAGKYTANASRTTAYDASRLAKVGAEPESKELTDPGFTPTTSSSSISATADVDLKNGKHDGSFARSRMASDGTTTRQSSLEVAKTGKEWSGRREKSHVIAPTKDEMMMSKTAYGWKDGKADLERTRASKLKDVETGETTGDATKHAVTWSKDGTTLSRQRQQSYAVGDDVFTEGYSVTGSKDALGVSTSRSHVVNDEAGKQQSKQNVTTTGTIGKKGASADRSWKSENVDAGWNTTAGLGASADWDKQTVGAKVSRTTDYDAARVSDATLTGVPEEWQPTKKSAATSASLDLDVAKGKVDGQFTRKSSRSDGTTTVSGATELGKKGSDYTARYERERKIAVDDDNQMTTKTGVGWKNKKASVDREKSSRIRDLDTNLVDADSQKTSVSWDKKGPAASHERSSTVEVGNEAFSSGWGVSGSLEKGSLSRSHAKVTTDESGEKTRDHRSTNVSVSGDGVQGGRTWGTVRPDGTGSATSVGANVDWDKRQAGVSLARQTTGSDGKASTVSGSGSLGVDESGGINHARGQLGQKTKEGDSVSISGEYQVTASAPQRVAEGYMVSWSRRIAAGFAGKSKRGLGASAEASENDVGSRIFATEAEAKAFSKNAAAMIPKGTGSPDTAQAALELGVGESRGSGDQLALGAQGEVSVGAATASASLTRTSGEGKVVQRISETLFQVTTTDRRSTDVAGAFGIGGVGGGGHVERGRSSSRTVQFDLSTTQGRKAFEHFQSTGEIITGGKEIATEEGKQQTKGTRLDFGAAGGATEDAQTFESERLEGNDRLESYGGRHSREVRSKIPFLKGHDASSVSLVSTEVNDQLRALSLRGRVDASRGVDSRDHLARMTGVPADGSGGKSSGKWDVQAVVTEAHIEKFLGTVASEKARGGAFAGSPRNRLRVALAQASSSDDRLRAMAEFVAAEGEGALRQVRETVFPSGGNFEYDLELEGDPNFLGVAGRVALEDDLAKWQAAFAADPAAGRALLPAIEAKWSEVRRRRLNIVKDEKYTDLPSALRTAQLGQLDGYLKTLVSLRERAAIAGTAPLPRDEASDGEGADDPLHALREELALLDTAIASCRRDVELARRQAIAASKSVQETTRGRLRPETGRHFAKAGEAMTLVAAMDKTSHEIRANFLKTLATPDIARGIGLMLQAQLEVTYSTYEAAKADYEASRDHWLGERQRLQATELFGHYSAP